MSSTWSTPTALLSAASSSTSTADYSVGRMQCNSTYGAWYNYAAATAGTITGESNTTEATYSICPKGWRLPTSNEFSSPLAYEYNAGSIASFNPVASGYYLSGILEELSRYGQWWAATSDNNTTSRSALLYDHSFIIVVNYRYFGLSVRCIKS